MAGESSISCACTRAGHDTPDRYYDIRFYLSAGVVREGSMRFGTVD